MEAQIKLGRIFGTEIGLHYSLADHRSADCVLAPEMNIGGNLIRLRQKALTNP